MSKKLPVGGLFIHYFDDDTWIENIEPVLHNGLAAVRVTFLTGNYGEPRRTILTIANGEVLEHDIPRVVSISVWKDQWERVDLEDEEEESEPAS